MSVINASFLLPLFSCSLRGINQPTRPGQTASADMETSSPKSLSLLSMGHWSSPPVQGRSFSYKPWFMMLWWWVSLVLCWLVCSHMGFPFMFSISLSPLCSPFLWACSSGGVRGSVVSRVVAVLVAQDLVPGTSSLLGVFAVAVQQSAWVSQELQCSAQSLRSTVCLPDRGIAFLAVKGVKDQGWI